MKTTYLLLAAICLLIGACNRPSSPLGHIPDEIDYNFHVKPILSDRCFACHGPDAQKREADLRLDEEESAFKALKSGLGHAIVPGDADQSLLTKRILSTDPSYQMPPPESNLALTEQEKAILIKWIEQGAAYKAHWAFTKPKKPKVPQVGGNWAENEIDRFVADKLDTYGIAPAPKAEREQLIRRAYFDVNGLPPSLEDLEKWMGDTRADYYERMVDSLLSLPAFGERMAAHWLDVARFADSEGYLDDFHHTFWPYRDWVIEAFNQNLSYDQFILWQVGGDQIPDASPSQRLATAFNRNHKQNSEGGIIPEEFRVDYVADRTHTVGAAFMALTVGCARCHDHKYDPFSQENYYQFFGFFNSTIERGDAIFSENALEYGQKVSNRNSMSAGPVMPLPSKEVAEIHAYLLGQIEQKEQEVSSQAERNTPAFLRWSKGKTQKGVLKKMLSESTLSHFSFDDMANGKVSGMTPASGRGTYYGSIASAKGIKGKAIRSNANGQFIAPGEHIAFERIDPFSVSFWIQTPKEFEEAHVLYNGNDRIQGYRGWDIMLDSTRIHFRLNHAHPFQSLDIRVPEQLPLNEWVHFVWTYDGSSKAEGMKVYQNGKQTEVQIMRDFLYRSTKPFLKEETKATVYKPYKGMIIGNRHYDQDFTGGLLDEIRVLDKEAGSLMALYLYDKDQGQRAFQEAWKAQNGQLDEFYDLYVDIELEKARLALRGLQAREVETIDTVQEIMVMGDRLQDRPTYVLDRGIYDAHGKQVEKGVPNSILPWPEELPKNRYGLGQWLIHPDHPLTARVAVNQIWYLMFGKGIVETVEDFGNQGALPSHPKLLDWLALDFMEHGWDVKRLVKQILLSATYQQSSKIRPELAEIDPDNALLARGTRYRRSAEMVRDNILASSGLLEEKMGGPSVFPYQPDGLWKEAMANGLIPEYQVDYEQGLYRRSIYTFWKRLMPPPNMLVFDAASRGECQMRRQQSSSPLQALVLMNDEQMIEGCRAIAEKIWNESQADPPKALQLGFQLLTSRQASEIEQEILHKQYKEEWDYFDANPSSRNDYLQVGKYRVDPELPPTELAALARVTNTILNTTEAYYKN